MTDLKLGDKTGMKAALEQVVQAGDPVPGTGEAQQLALLPLCEIDEQTGQPEKGSPAGRGRGRPPGSQNKSTKEWAQFLLSRYPSPLVALAETYSRRVADLAIELGFTKIDDQGRITRQAKPEELLELFKTQLQCAKELAPYVHQKQPTAIDAGENGLMQLIINTGAATQQQVDEAGLMNVQFLDAEIIENQGLSEDEKQNSVAGHSVANEKGESDQHDNNQRPTD